MIGWEDAEVRPNLGDGGGAKVRKNRWEEKRIFSVFIFRPDIERRSVYGSNLETFDLGRYETLTKAHTHTLLGNGLRHQCLGSHRCRFVVVVVVVVATAATASPLKPSFLHLRLLCMGQRGICV